MAKPLAGVRIADFSHVIAGPLATQFLCLLGAEVIKVEPPTGDVLRNYTQRKELRGMAEPFIGANAGKKSIVLDLKSDSGREAALRLIATSDIMVENFRPGVIDRLGLDYESVKAINPGIVYASITGYGEEGPWVQRPGQDLLAQARSGVMWLNGDHDQGPVPFGLAIADMLAGAAVAQGILAALVQKGRTGRGAHVETSLLEALIDFQFEVLTTHLNDGRRKPKRSDFRSAHAYLSAPYGVYATADGWLALAMTPLGKIRDLLELPALDGYAADPKSWFTARDEIKRLIADRLATKPTADWLAILEPADIWCAKVLEWPELLESDGFTALDMLQTVTRDDGVSILTTRSPLRIDGARTRTTRAAPLIGEQSAQIRKEFDL